MSGCAALVAVGATPLTAVGDAAEPASAVTTAPSATGTPVPETDASPVPVEELTTATSTTFLQPDGSFESTIFTVPVNFRDGSGGWRPIDNTLVPASGDAWAVRNAANDYTVQIPADASQDPVRVSDADRWATFQLRGADGAPQVDSTEATFNDVADAAEVSYEATGYGVKESIILTEAPRAPVSYVYDVALSSGLTPRLTATGSIDVVDGSGAVVFTMPAPSMADSAPEEPAVSAAVTYELAEDSSGWVLTVRPDQGWLTDPARVYPVVVDPTITNDAPTADCYVTEETPSSQHCAASTDYVKAGTTAAGAKRRGLVRFDLSTIPVNATVTSTDLQLYLDASQTSAVRLADYTIRRATREWTNQASWNSYDGDPAHTWNGGGPWSPGALDYASTELSGQTSGYKHWHPTQLVQEWVSGTWASNTGFVVKQDTENVDSVLWFYSSGAAGQQAKWPKLTVSYSEPTPPAAANGAGQRRFFTYTSEQLTDKLQAQVNVGNGNLLVTGTDARIAGTAGLDLVLQRTYNSLLFDSANPSKLGPGWSTGLGGSVRLEFPLADSNRVLFFAPTGYRVRFERNAGGDYIRHEPGLDANLRRDGSDYRLEWYSKDVYVFNAAGRLTSMRDKQGNQLTLTYTAGGDLDYVVDTRGRKADFSYNGAGLLSQVEVQTPTGTPLIRYAYGYSSTTPARLTSSQVSYVNTTALPNVEDTVNIGAVTRYSYDTAGRLDQIEDARETSSDPAGGTTQVTYTGITGQVASLSRLTDDSGLPDSTSSYTYLDANGPDTDCYKDAAPVGTKHTIVNGERTDVTDTTTYCVDDHSRVRRTVDAKGNVRSSDFTTNSNVETMDMSGLGDGGQSYGYSYSGNDNLTQTTLPSGGKNLLSYGDASNPHFPTASRDFATNGNPSSVAIWAYDYDDNGNLIEAEASGPDITYRYCWDGDGLLQRIDPPDGSGNSSTSLDNDPNAGCGYANQGNDTLLHYDTDGQLTQVDPPGPHGTRTYTYDALSRVATMTDGRGEITSYTYDALDHTVEAHYEDDPTSLDWTYDASGNLTDLEDPHGQIEFDYDELNRRTEESASLASSGDITYTHDPADNITSIDVSDEPAPTLYTYDAVNLVTSVDDQRSSSNIVTFDYDKRDNRIETVYPIAGANNDVVQAARYDDGGRLTCVYSYRENNAPSNGENVCPAATFVGLLTFFKYDYTSPGGFDTNTRYQVTELGGQTTDYTYDAITRLKTATTNASGGAELRKFVYTYDRHTNLTREVVTGTTPGLQTGTTSMAFNDAEELCWSATGAHAPTCASAPSGATSYSYDGAGSLTTGTGGVNDGLDLDYNVIGQTTSIDPPGTTGDVDMAYQGITQDRRTSAGDTDMSYNGLGLSAQDTANGTDHAEWFVRDPAGKLVSMVDRDAYEPDLYYLTDGQNSVVATIDTTGVVTRYLYEPYGQKIRSWVDPNAGQSLNTGSENPNAQPPANDYNPWRYASGYHDPATGLLKYGTRYYHPTLNRWTQTDPITGTADNPMSLNPYAYVGANPTNSTDPAGRSAVNDPGQPGPASSCVSYVGAGCGNLPPSECPFDCGAGPSFEDIRTFALGCALGGRLGNAGGLWAAGQLAARFGIIATGPVGWAGAGVGCAFFGGLSTATQ